MRSYLFNPFTVWLVTFIVYFQFGYWLIFIGSSAVPRSNQIPTCECFGPTSAVKQFKSTLFFMQTFFIILVAAYLLMRRNSNWIDLEKILVVFWIVFMVNRDFDILIQDFNQSPTEFIKFNLNMLKNSFGYRSESTH